MRMRKWNHHAWNNPMESIVSESNINGPLRMETAVVKSIQVIRAKYTTKKNVHKPLICLIEVMNIQWWIVIDSFFLVLCVCFCLDFALFHRCMFLFTVRIFQFRFRAMDQFKCLCSIGMPFLVYISAPILNGPIMPLKVMLWPFITITLKVKHVKWLRFFFSFLVLMR